MGSMDSALDDATSFQPNVARKQNAIDRGQTWLSHGARYMLLSFFALFFVVPFVWMFLASFKPQSEIFQYIYPVGWQTFIPQTWTLENFRALLELKPYAFTHYILNSVFVAVA